MTDEARARAVVENWESDGYSPIGLTDAESTKLQTLIAAAFRAVRAKVWEEAHNLLCREGWDMSLEQIKAYMREQAAIRATNQEKGE